ncbi:hypothetical protein [Streptomyces atratus]|uniref:hypothetical protein n=1 Tax=Streptomyces atratus TaxID=1893 RepID=UPI003408D5C2
MSYRVVIKQAVLEQPSTMAELSGALHRTRQVRVVDRVPTKLVVADRSVALLPLLSPAEEEAATEAMVVRAGGLVRALVAMTYNGPPFADSASTARDIGSVPSSPEELPRPATPSSPGSSR